MGKIGPCAATGDEGHIIRVNCIQNGVLFAFADVEKIEDGLEAGNEKNVEAAFEDKSDQEVPSGLWRRGFLW